MMLETLMNKLLNYLGQLRIYSLVDLALMIYVAGARGQVFWGVIILWVGFLAYLENQHKHAYRLKIPRGFWVILIFFGLILFRRVEGIGFVVVSYLYTCKNKKNYGIFAPFFRGMQSFLLVGGVAGFDNILTWLALLLTVGRNLLGDFRDAGKDATEGMKTLPIFFGWKRNLPVVHLLGIWGTTFVWWHYSGLGVAQLLFLWAIQLASYNLTPR